MSQDEMRDDLKALRSVSERERPDLDRTMRAARLRHESGGAARKEWLMSAVTVMKRRPWIATATAALAIALALLVVPISYERATGHQVNLTIAGELESSRLASIARGLKGALGAKSVNVEMQSGTEAAPVTVMSAFVPAGAGAFDPSAAQAFAKELEAKGYHASASTQVVKEHTSGNVYAFARDQMITIEASGKSAAQLEAEIRQRLSEAGIPDAQVSVTDEPNGSRNVKVEMQRESNGPTIEEPKDLDLVLTKDNVIVSGSQTLRAKVIKLKSSDGSQTLRVEVSANDRKATAEVKNPDALGDAGTAAEIERQLSAAGIQAQVTVSNGKVEIKNR